VQLGKLGRLAGGYTAHMTKHHPAFGTILGPDGDGDLASLEDPDDYSTAPAPRSARRRCPPTEALRKYTTDEVRAMYVRVPDASELVSSHGLRSADAVYAPRA
jgi:hypothetical protein